MIHNFRYLESTGKQLEPVGRNDYAQNFLGVRRIRRYAFQLMPKLCTKEAMQVLMHYSFPGNVRELENIIERAIILEKGPLITPESLPQTIKMFQIETLEPDRVKTIEELNKDYAEKVLDMLGGNKSKAAEVLGISRTSLWRILKEE